jgi:hypothetical protein
MSFEHKLKSIYESNGRDATYAALHDAIAEKKIDANRDWSIRRLFEAFHGHDWMEKMQGGKPIMESPESVSLSSQAAVGIAGQFLLSIIKDAYTAQKSAVDELITTIGVSNQNLGAEVVGYVSSPSSLGEVVNEGEAFPADIVATQSVTLPAIVKWGRILNVSFEAAAGDKTSQIIKQAEMIGTTTKTSVTYHKYNVILGYLNQYIFNTNQLSTYYTAAAAGPFVNKITSFNITDYSSINQLEQTILNQVDPYNPNLPIELLDRKQVLVVPQSLYKLKTILEGEAVRGGNYAVAGNNIATYAKNPLVAGEYEVHSDIYVQKVLQSNGMSYADSANFILFGNLKKAFMYREFRPLELTILPQPSTWNITNDTLFSCRAVTMGSAGVYEPRAVCLGVVS